MVELGSTISEGPTISCHLLPSRGVQTVRQDDVARKFVGSVLIGDAEAVSEATSGHQEDGLAVRGGPR